MVRTISSIILTILLLPIGLLAAGVVITAYSVLLPAVILLTAVKIADYLSLLLFDTVFDQINSLSISQYIGVGFSIIPAIIAVSVFSVLAAPIFLILCTGSFSHQTSMRIIDKLDDYFSDGDIIVQPPLNTYLTEFRPVEAKPWKEPQPYSTYDLSFFTKLDDMDEKKCPEPSNHIKLNFYKTPTKAVDCQSRREERPNPSLN